MKAILYVGFAALLASMIASCDALALAGHEKYKVDLNNVFLTISQEIDNEGVPTQKSVDKLESILNNNREEFSGKGSFVRAEDALKSLKAALAEPDKAYSHNQQAKIYITQTQDLLQTETGN